MKTNWHCRDYQPGDEYEILTINNEFNDRKMTLEHWKWKFIQNPFGRAIIKLMFDGNKLIGHRAAMPTMLSVYGKTVPAAIIVNTLTHPAYRKLGISTDLAGEIYRQAEKQGFKFIYNFPNPDSYPLYSKIDGWEMLDQRSVWQKWLTSETIPQLGKKSIIKQVAGFDQRVDRLWDKLRQNYGVVVPRVSKFLNWRFTQHPTEKYFIFFIEDEDDLSGYLVLKIYSREQQIKGHIVDVLCINERDIGKSLLDVSYQFFNKRRIGLLSCWMPRNNFFSSILKDEGFSIENMENHFGLRVLDRKVPEKIRTISNWHLTMADSDVF